MKKYRIMPDSQYTAMKEASDLAKQQPKIQQDAPLTPSEPENLNRPSVIFNDPRREKILKVEEELKSLLAADMNVEEKAPKYNNTLLGFLNLLKTLNKEEPSIHRSLPIGNKEPESPDFETLLESTLPPSSKNIGLRLYRLLKNRDDIHWAGPTGEIKVNDQIVPGSHIVDLISDLVRRWNMPPLPGWNIIAPKLKDLPRSLVQNVNRKADLDYLQLRPSITSLGGESPSSLNMPVGSGLDSLGQGPSMSNPTPSRPRWITKIKPNSRPKSKKKPYPSTRDKTSVMMTPEVSKSSHQTSSYPAYSNTPKKKKSKHKPKNPYPSASSIRSASKPQWITT